MFIFHIMPPLTVVDVVERFALIGQQIRVESWCNGQHCGRQLWWEVASCEELVLQNCIDSRPGVGIAL